MKVDTTDLRDNAADEIEELRKLVTESRSVVTDLVIAMVGFHAFAKVPAELTSKVYPPATEAIAAATSYMTRSKL